MFFNEPPNIETRDPQLKVPPGVIVLRRPQPGLNPRTLGFEARMLSRDHQGRFIYLYFLFTYLFRPIRQVTSYYLLFSVYFIWELKKYKDLGSHLEGMSSCVDVEAAVWVNWCNISVFATLFFYLPFFFILYALTEAWKFQRGSIFALRRGGLLSSLQYMLDLIRDS